MKHLILAILMVITTAAHTAPHNHGGHNNGHSGGHWTRGHGGGWLWAVPVIIGGAIVYQATQPQTTIIVQPIVDSNCSPWTEIQNPDGTITRTRTCNR